MLYPQIIQFGEEDPNKNNHLSLMEDGITTMAMLKIFPHLSYPLKRSRIEDILKTPFWKNFPCLGRLKIYGL
jgi:hypothetical protein